MNIKKSNDKVKIEMEEDDFESLSTMIFEFCYSLDERKDKHGNYKNKVWYDCLQFRDKFFSALPPKEKD